MAGRGASGRLEVWFADLADAAPLEAALRHLGLLSCLPPARPDPLRRLAHGALRLLLSHHLGTETAREPFVVAARGKPSIASAPATLGFSLAHSGAHALIALSSAGEVGVDIEGPRRLQMSDVRRDALVRAAEVVGGGLLAGADEHVRALQAWVRLEAVAKATGEGIGAVLERLGARPGRPMPSEALARAGLGGVVDLALPDGLQGALAWTATTLRIDALAVRVLPMSTADLVALAESARDTRESG